MNVFATNTAGCQTVAQQIIAERVQDAERRAAVRAVKAELRAERREARRVPRKTYHQPLRALPYWTFRFVRPAH